MNHANTSFQHEHGNGQPPQSHAYGGHSSPGGGNGNGRGAYPYTTGNNPPSVGQAAQNGGGVVGNMGGSRGGQDGNSFPGGERPGSVGDAANPHGIELELDTDYGFRNFPKGAPLHWLRSALRYHAGAWHRQPSAPAGVADAPDGIIGGRGGGRHNALFNALHCRIVVGEDEEAAGTLRRVFAFCCCCWLAQAGKNTLN